MARNFDVFNGDADGLCAVHQYRLAHPADSVLVTGVKRDIKLLERVDAASGDHVSVFDISLDSNRPALERLLQSGAEVVYFDHHYAGEIPRHAALHATIDTAPDICSALLVDRVLRGRFRLWAIVAAFGDNLDETGRRLAAEQGLADADSRLLARLGECLNYNGYGDAIADLHIAPEQLYGELRPYASPLEFAIESASFAMLEQGMAADLAHLPTLRPERESGSGALYVLPDAPWSRRVSGVFANRLARGAPDRAHAVLTPDPHGTYTVSVRAPRSQPSGADALCRRFPNGGGRAAAAGINRLATIEVEAFAAAFAAQRW